MTRRAFFALVTACLAAFGFERRKTEKQRVVDMAEQKLFDVIRASDNTLTIFYLKSKPTRGYRP